MTIKITHLPNDRPLQRSDFATEGGTSWMPTESTALVREHGFTSLLVWSLIISANMNNNQITASQLSRLIVKSPANTSHQINKLINAGYLRKEGKNLIAIDKEGVFPNE